MTLAAKITKEAHDALPDALKAEYIEKDGSFLVDIQPVEGFALENITGLQNALSATRTERDTALETAKVFDGIDAEAAKTAIIKVKEYASFDPDQKIAEGIKAQKEMIIGEHNKAMNVKDDTIGKLTSQVEKHLIDSTATVAINDAKGNLTLLMPHIKQQTRMKEVDGNYIAQILDGNKNVRIGDTQGTNMTMKQLVDEMKTKPEFASAFEGTGSSGTTTKPGGSSEKTKAALKEKGEAKVIDANDQEGLNSSLADIASGKTKVQFNNNE